MKTLFTHRSDYEYTNCYYCVTIYQSVVLLRNSKLKLFKETHKKPDACFNFKVSPVSGLAGL